MNDDMIIWPLCDSCTKIFICCPCDCYLIAHTHLLPHFPHALEKYFLYVDRWRKETGKLKLTGRQMCTGSSFFLYFIHFVAREKSRNNVTLFCFPFLYFSLSIMFYFASFLSDDALASISFVPYAFHSSLLIQQTYKQPERKRRKKDKEKQETCIGFHLPSDFYTHAPL
ncbi:hypothetical protein CROQUDRAFT_492613 [Cronartium quercuum f. sp. fusiforme G11]|uniref:Uncharacterized protein n=1 Tax=Cronartium quercuum f. sp. fusiforme G11 TaxID=708437 RepID=A0A9P6T6B3_9BASI|nr:hypothetical protein CROQUDRAFT_492613 [Cronartium quercuum f. sp. fusiforme G11]